MRSKSLPRLRLLGQPLGRRVVSSHDTRRFDGRLSRERCSRIVALSMIDLGNIGICKQIPAHQDVSADMHMTWWKLM